MPVEFLQYVIIRPFTLAVRLFANMFAGHILIAGVHPRQLVPAHPRPRPAVQRDSFILAIALTALEVLIQFLQAYIFTLLAPYISGALEEGH